MTHRTFARNIFTNISHGWVEDISHHNDIDTMAKKRKAAKKSKAKKTSKKKRA